MTIDQLQQRFGIANMVRFEAGNGGLPRMVLTTAAAEAHVYLHGAHVSHYQRRGEPPVLWMSGKSWFEANKPIRGGVPVIFPWFGARPGRPESPNHGFARLMEWVVDSIEPTAEGSLAVTLVLRSDAATLAAWPHPFELRFTVTVGPTLRMALEVRNTGKDAFTFTEALHTYFDVKDVRRVKVTGLEGAELYDKVPGSTEPRRRQGQEPIIINGENDLAFVNTRTTCVLDDAGYGRRLTVTKGGSDSTVVWNPWIAKARAMPDFGDDEWPGMICIETCNIMDNAVRLEAGGSHGMTAEIS